MNGVGDTGSHRLLVSRRAMPCPSARSVADSAAAHEHLILVDSFGCLRVTGANAAGGADTIVAAQNIGSGTARDEGVGGTTSWQGGMLRGDFEARYSSEQMKVNAGTTATTKYESKSVHEDKPARALRGGQYQGRVVGAAFGSGDSVSSVGWAGAQRSGEPALGVMGGLLQPVSSPAEPPVSSLSGPPAVPSTTAPAPFEDLSAGDVSPLADAVRAAVGVVRSRPTAVSVLPRGRAGSAQPPHLTLIDH